LTLGRGACKIVFIQAIIFIRRFAGEGFMNIGLFADIYYPEISGVVTSTQVLARELIAAGHNAYVFTPRYPGGDDEPFVHRVTSLPAVVFQKIRVAVPYTVKDANIIRDCNLDIIHTQTELSLGYLGRHMAKELGLPIIHTYHTLYKDYTHYLNFGKPTSRYDTIIEGISRNYLKRCTAVIAPSQKVYDLLAQYGVNRPVYIVPTGVPLGSFDSANRDEAYMDELRLRAGVGPGQPVVLSLGRLSREKSVDVTISAMPEVIAAIPGAKLVVIGDGPDRGRLEGLAAKLGVGGSVSFLGYVPWEKINSAYSIGDVFVFASSTTETQGLAFVEAMAAGTCVIARRDASNQGILQDGQNSLLFERADQLASIITRALGDDRLRRTLAANGLKTADGISGRKFATDMIEVYKKAITSNKSRPVSMLMRDKRTRARRLRALRKQRKYRDARK